MREQQNDSVQGRFTAYLVVALVCVVAVSLTAMFRTESGNLISSIFDTMTTNVNDTLFKEFVVV